MTSVPRGPIGRWAERVLSTDGFELALRLTLLSLLLQPVGNESLRPWVVCLAAVGLLVPNITRRVELWGALALLTGLRVVQDWPLGDNHSYLLTYWCLAITLSLCTEDASKNLARHGRWLIGLVFGFAVLWKAVLSADFLDGTFFRVMLLTDPRFEDFVRLMTSLTSEQIELQRSALLRHADGGMLPTLSPARLPASFDVLARFMTGWTLGIEGLVAACFLWPRRLGALPWRDVLLLAFCASTYAVATVAGFGWLVIAMGIAQCDHDRGRTRACYVACYGLVLFYREVPWTRLILEMSGSG